MSTAQNVDTERNPSTPYSYDTVPYPSNPFPQTHADHLESIARLFRLSPAEAGHCRMLEIGCASGGNLIPMAEQLPESHFCGIDLSQRQVADGQQIVEALGLGNIELRHCNILDVDESFGDFDYIICHGVFSWVPAQVQSKILEICRERLRPRGVAYISYNTNPGWYMRGMIRSMMCYHVADTTGASQKIEQARALLRFLDKTVSDKDSAFGKLLKSELDTLTRQSDAYLFHEHLEECNEPMYFHEFVEMAQQHDLKYLGESKVSTMYLGNFPEHVATTLEMIAPNMIKREQYMDFLINRTFRQTLLCHSNVGVSRNWNADSIRSGYLSASLRMKDGGDQIDLAPSEAVTFVDAGGGRQVTSRDPLVKSAIYHLSHSWPGSMKFDELAQASQLSLGSDHGPQDSAALEQSLASNLMHLFVKGFVELRVSPHRFTTRVSDQPEVSPLARLQAKSGQRRLTNRRHEVVNVDTFISHVAAEADGSKTSADLLGIVRRLVDEGVLSIKVQGAGNVASADVEEGVLQSCLDKALSTLAQNAFLIA